MEQPMPFRPSELTQLVNRLAASLKAPEVDWALEQAGAAPAPAGGKRQRLRAALEATQRRDGHAGTLARLLEVADRAPAMRERRAELLEHVTSGPVSPRARIDTGFGEWLDVGVAYPEWAAALVLTLDGEDTAVPLTKEASADLRRALAEIHNELSRRGR